MTKRLLRCQKQLKKQGFQALLVSHPADITYITGAQKIDGYLLVSLDQPPKFFTNFLYTQEVSGIKGIIPVIAALGESIFSLLAQHMRRFKDKKIGFNPKHTAYLEYKTLLSYFINKNIEFLPAGNIIEHLRAIKDKNEIINIKKSIAISLEAFLYVREISSPHMSEKGLALEIDKFLRLKGDNELAFETIVAAGANASFPHHRPDESIIGKKNVLIDLGSRYHGYCADLTRVIICSKMPNLLRKINDTLLKAQSLAIKKIRPGVKISDVDKAARGHIERLGWGKNFGHGLGHGVGLEVHEEPYLGPNNKNYLQEGMVLTIEPAIYINKRLGFRIEDMVAVTAKKAEVLSGNGNW